MTSSIDAARSFLESIGGYADNPNGAEPSHDRPVKLGVVDLAYDGTGQPRVKFDGESVMGVRTYVALQPVASGDRVVMLPVGRTYVILGATTGLDLDLGNLSGVLGIEHGGTGSPLALPGAVYVAGPATTTVTNGAGSWATLGAMVPIKMTPERDLVVEVDVNAVCKASTGYTMIGVSITGGLDLPPDNSPMTGGSPGAFYTPYTSSTVDTAIRAATKRVTLPAGEETTLTMWARRNVSSGTHTCNYPLLSVRPVRWA